MAITRAFGGQTLLKPGAYSVSRVDNAQGLAVGDNDTIMLIGEASDGIPGGVENSRVFTTSQIQGLVDYYVSGDIVDAALAASRPSITPGISGPTNYVVYKTNSSVKARNTIPLSGVAPTLGDTYTVAISFPINASGQLITETVTLTVDSTVTTAALAASALAALLTANNNLNSVFEFAVDGTTDTQVNMDARKHGPQFGYGSARNAFNPDGQVVIVESNAGNATPTADFGSPGLEEVVAAGATDIIVTALNQLAQVGATTASELASAFTDAFNFDSNVIVPLWSNDSTGTQPNNRPNAGTNFVAIRYQEAAAALQSHLIERSSVTVRKEAQGIIGANDTDWRTTYGTLNAAGISSFLVQACIQDVRIIDSSGALTWKAPHIMAAIMAGVRLGSTVGEPLTFKFINANGVGHNIDAMTGLPIAAVSQFRPGFDFNEAILQGLTFTELASGGNRIVVDNTRYAIDESFVFNRGSVIEAAQFVARTSRDVLETIFVGQKVSNGAAESLKNVLRNYLISLNADNIITSSSDAPFGFVEDTFTVSITGNTAEIQVEVKPVQGLDFIFINFTLGNITQSA